MTGNTVQIQTIYQEVIIMSRIAVVYWSGTGNTQAMAEKVAEGAQAAGGEVSIFTPDAFDPATIGDYDAIAFGCPAMGAEELEDSEFAPMFESCRPALSGKSVVLFGSYGWGDGQWMRDWEETVTGDGAVLAAGSVICNDYPDDDAEAACVALGQAIA